MINKKFPYMLFCTAILCFNISYGQITSSLGYQKDSLQIKVYTTLVVDKNLQVEDIYVRKLFCNYCNEDQATLLEDEAKRKTFLLRNSPEYIGRPGKHKMALYIRMSKEDFKNLNLEE